ncbi:pentapeptide repeat-containing protein [Microcoleus sp. FACHB-SPT15]|uniref:pentapeptide repeat-containing protein n=1 Tax=Microcoleus sp. FACHB-SPT15 TaxID=2692830 RepID=UPI0017828903|nr:pentapeptide repeat-containing protein [Microcoleus sp. FACHB-SPT15]MBD1806391.1 pentapeptide repeat-containing protein [Microcoleus sp. FACHB-SPT15]
MASPSIKRSKSQEVGQSFPLRLHLALPLVTRRCAAVLMEVSLVAASALVPYSIGLYAKEHSTAQPVPLNPVLASTEEAIAETLAYPLRELHTRQVAPLTNLFWCGALVMPVVVVSWQLYRLGKTGKTTPKDWLGIQVVTAYGTAPGLLRVIWREGVGRWGIPVGTAYLLWRYTGAFPDIGILLGLAGLMLLAESASALFNSRRRTLHDRLAGTYVVEAGRVPPYSERFHPRRGHEQFVTLEVENGWQSPSEDTTTSQRPERTVTTIVLTSQQPNRRSLNLWLWMRRHPGLTLLIIAFAGMASVLGTFVGTQIYIQSQANRREFKQQDNEVFLALVKQLSSTSPTALEERRGALLALARLDDSRAVPLLVDMLGQERTPTLIDAIQQALVSTGPESLPALRRLNQSLQNDQETLKRRGAAKELQIVALRQRATSRAIAKILTVYAGQTHNADLSRTNLGQVNSGAAQFTLVLDNLDLSGINFRSAILSNASLRNSRFYGAGEDQRFGTFDDSLADLSGADLKEADLTGANLSNVPMNRTNFVRATLNQANLSNSHLGGANLSSTQLIGADLQQAMLENASLTGANLGQAKLGLSNLHGARLGQANAMGGDFSYADLSQSNWQGADLSRANLSNANLREADLSATKLVEANLSNAQLQNANLRNSNLSAANLQGANLTGADFLGVTFAAATPGQSNQFLEKPPSAATAARVKGVNFAKAKNLDAKQIKFICANGGQHPQCP